MHLLIGFESASPSKSNDHIYCEHALLYGNRICCLQQGVVHVCIQRFAGWLRELKLKFYAVVIILAIVLVYTDSHNTMANLVTTV
jgi:hypothetical protein